MPLIAPARPKERRRDQRFRTPGLLAWISGPLSTAVTIRDLGLHGAALESPVPLRARMIICLRLLVDGELFATRRALVVRARDGIAGISFVD